MTTGSDASCAQRVGRAAGKGVSWEAGSRAVQAGSKPPPGTRKSAAEGALVSGWGRGTAWRRCRQQPGAAGQEASASRSGGVAGGVATPPQRQLAGARLPGIGLSTASRQHMGPPAFARAHMALLCEARHAQAQHPTAPSTHLVADVAGEHRLLRFKALELLKHGTPGWEGEGVHDTSHAGGRKRAARRPAGRT